MRPEAGALPLLLLIAAIGALAACVPTSSTRPGDVAPEPVVDKASSQALMVSSHLEVLQRLLGGLPAEQAEVVATARRDFEDAPTPSRQLRYALVLATPGHASTSPAEAARLLRELMATPESLVPAERSLARLELAQLERLLALSAESTRLQAALDRTERDRNTSTNRKLQAEIEENARLRKSLEEAQRKLDAIANIERSITERKPQTEGRTP